MKVRRILFPTDFSSCAGAAFGSAISLARRYQAEVHLLHAVVATGGITTEAAYGLPNPEDLLQLAESSADEQLGQIDVDGVPLSRVRLRGIAAAPVILDYAKAEEIDLIVMGTHGRRGLGRLFLGSVAEEVVRLACCPVMTFRGRGDGEPAEEPAAATYRQILVPVDFSSHSDHALSLAAEMAGTYGAEIQLLHVVQPVSFPPVYSPLGGTLPAIDYPELMEQARKGLEELVASRPALEGRTTLHVLEGYAATTIVEFAERHGSDLVILATQGLTGLPHLLLGSVAERVVRLAPCPVLTVKRPGVPEAA